MAFCPHCGHPASAGARFCTNCGTALNGTATRTTTSRTSGTGYSVMLVSVGTCRPAVAADLLEDLCGYTDEESRLIVASAPITVAQNLSGQQASLLAQAMDEYGMDVSVYDNGGYKTVSSNYNSVYTDTGDLLTDVAAILGLISTGNRIARSNMRRWDYPNFGAPVIYRAPKAPYRPAPARHNVRGPVRPVPPTPIHSVHPVQPTPPRPTNPARPAGPARPASSSRPAGGAPRPAGSGHGGPGGRGGNQGGPGGFGGPMGHR